MANRAYESESDTTLELRIVNIETRLNQLCSYLSRQGPLVVSEQNWLVRQWLLPSMFVPSNQRDVVVVWRRTDNGAIQQCRGKYVPVGMVKGSPYMTDRRQWAIGDLEEVPGVVVGWMEIEEEWKEAD